MLFSTSQAIVHRIYCFALRMARLDSVHSEPDPDFIDRLWLYTKQKMNVLNFNRIKRTILTIPLFFAVESYAQNSSVDFQTWTDVTLTYFTRPKLSIGGDIGLRGIVSSKDWNLFYIRPSIDYSISPMFRVSGSIGSFTTFYNDLGKTTEIRFSQGVSMSWPDFGWIDFYHRIRLEERFFIYEKLKNSWSIRGRYLIRARTADFRLIGKTKSFYLKGMWELFIPFDKSSVELFINNQRFYAAIGQRASDKFRYEIFYIRQQSREFSDDGFQTSENIIRLRFFYALKLPDQE